MRLVLTLSLLLVTTRLASAAVTLPQFFSDNMVLQASKPLRIWGRAAPGEKIKVTLGDISAETTAAGGRWMVTLPPQQASLTPRELVVQGTNTRRVRNVAVGEVWLASGDFGVYYEMFSVVNGAQEIANSANPQLRLFKQPAARSSNQPLDDVIGTWQVSGPHSVGSFSGAGYLFGRALQQELKVPVGIIDASYRYSYTKSFLSAEGIRMVPELKAYQERLDSFDPTTAGGREAHRAVLEKLQAWLPLARQALAAGKPVPPQPAFPAPIRARDDNYISIGELGVAYNGQIAPYAPMALRGFLWSQGESNAETAVMAASLQALAEGWRHNFQQPDLPFLYELLAAVGPPADGPCPPDAWVLTRDQQQQAAARIPNSDYIVSYDVSDYVAQERNRQDAARRFLALALVHAYGRKGLTSGPRYSKHTVAGGRVIINYTHTGGGLMAAVKNGLEPPQPAADQGLRLFTVAGADRKWHLATARIEGETVIVDSPAVPEPVAVRYAWCANPSRANLYNREGWPAAPFRTDDW